LSYLGQSEKFLFRAASRLGRYYFELKQHSMQYNLSLFRTRFFEKCTKLNTLHVNKQTTNLNFEVDLPPPMQETRL